MTLNDLQLPQSIGRKFVVQSLNGNGDSVRRLEELGFFPGAEIEVLLRLPLKGPWVVAIGAASFALRADEAAMLVIK